MAEEYTKRSKAINDIFDEQVTSDCLTEMDKVFNTGLRRAMSVLANLPAADVVPVRHGRWLSMDSEKVIAMDEYGCPVDSCRCSECGDWLTGSDEYWVRGRYCPNCGAKMDLEADGEVPETII